MMWIVLGMIGILAGIVLMVLSKVILGVVLLLAGVAAMAFHYVTMMRGQSMEPEQGTINGLAGQGKQQSEVVKAAQPNSGEESANIWDMVEDK